MEVAGRPVLSLRLRSLGLAAWAPAWRPCPAEWAARGPVSTLSALATRPFWVSLLSPKAAALALSGRRGPQPLSDPAAEHPRVPLLSGLRAKARNC